MDAERIMERVRRLLAIANDPAASDNEQRIALEQAQRLMDRHAIEEWQLEEDHDAIEIIRRMIHLEANPCNWYMAELANIVALGNRCRASYGRRRQGTRHRPRQPGRPMGRKTRHLQRQSAETLQAHGIQPVGLPARKTGRGTPGHRTQGDRQGRRLGSGKVGRHLQNITHV